MSVYLAKGWGIVQLIAVHAGVFFMMLMFIPLRVRHGKLALRVAACVASIAAVEFVNVTGVLAYILPEANRYILSVIAVALFYWIIFDVPFKQVLIASIDVYFMGQLLLAVITRLVYSELHVALKVFLTVINIPFIFAPNVLLLARPMRNDLNVKDKISLYFCVAASLGVVISVVLYNLLLSDGLYNTAYGFMSFLAWLLINYILVISQYRMYSANFTRQVQQVMYDEKLKQYQSFSASIDIINAKCHDLKRYAHELQSSSLPDGGEEYFKEIDEALTLYDSITDTGNSDLDAVISEKKMLCNRDNITLDYVIDAAELGFMSGFDIYMLFGNALENAIEACRKEDEDKRIISVKVGKRGAILVVNIENYCTHPPEFSGKKIVTSKTDKKYHGFGTVSVQNIAKKYGGNAEFSYSNNYFRLNVIFPLGK